MEKKEFRSRRAIHGDLPGRPQTNPLESENGGATPLKSFPSRKSLHGVTEENNSSRILTPQTKITNNELPSPIKNSDKTSKFFNSQNHKRVNAEDVHNKSIKTPATEINTSTSKNLNDAAKYQPTNPLDNFLNPQATKKVEESALKEDEPLPELGEDAVLSEKTLTPSTPFNHLSPQSDEALEPRVFDEAPELDYNGRTEADEISATGFERFHDSGVKISEIAEHEVLNENGEPVISDFDSLIKPPKRRKSKKKSGKNRFSWKILIPIVLVILLIIGGLVAFGIHAYKNTFATVPHGENSASEKDGALYPCEPFTELGLDCEASWEYSDTAPRESLISQSLAPGLSVKKGELIELIYSKGPKEAKVPELQGLDVEAAKKMIFEAGLNLGKIEEVDDEKTGENVVVSSTLKAGEVVPANTEIGLTVSSGLYTVPNWIGSPSEAVGIEAHELDLNVVYLEQEDTGPAGIVLSQSIEPGTQTKDREIEVTVSKSAEIVSAEIPDTTGMSADEAQVVLAEAGFTKLKVVEVPSSAAPGVFQTVPGVGQTAALSETIVIIVLTPQK